MNSAKLEQIIFGADATTGLVAVETDAEGMVVYLRTPEGIKLEREEFRPWLVAADQPTLAGAHWVELTGEGYSFLAEFERWSDFLEARQKLGAAGIDHFAYTDSVRQYLVRSGRTLFKGMDLGDLHTFQLDIETAALSPQEPEARIILICYADQSGCHIIEGEEREMLFELARVIAEADPDVIEGHNIFGFDLPYLASRAERYGLSLDWGRDGSAVRFGRQRRCTMGGRSRPFIPAYVRGRHFIDTMFAIQRFDAQAAELESYGLKEVCQRLGLAEPERILVDQAAMEAEWAADAERVREYARQDVVETARLSAHVMQTDFYLTQMVPDSYQNVACSGTGEKINSLFVREYLRQGIALPRPQAARAFPGGYVEVRRVGVIAPIVKVDVESLYPSIMLTERIAPETDTLGIFLPMLAELTTRRLEAKSKARAAVGPERVRLEGIQSSFKVLINSFYGYLGSSFLFNDFEAAERVTTRGQALVRMIADHIEQTGGEVVEIDTDGVYFKPPEGVRSEEEELAYVAEIGSDLPKGIKLQHDGRYRAMVSLKQKNYVCIGYDGRKVFRGAAVRSRADELFGREFLAEAIDCIIAGELEKLSERYRQMLADISAGRMGIERLLRRERVTEKTYASPAKRRSAAAAGNTPVGEYIEVYQRSDGSLARIEDYAGDEDRPYYAEKLYKFALRLREAIGPEFDQLFPRPSWEELKRSSAGQTSLEF